MIAATCCRCGRELDKKRGILLRAPKVEEVLFDGIVGDDVVKHHVCVSCMTEILEWMKLRGGAPGQPSPAERPAAPPGSPERRTDQGQVVAAETAETDRAALAELLKEMRPFLKYARDTWPEVSSPSKFIAQIDDLESRIDAALLQPPLAPSVHAGLPTTIHVLFEGRPLCGFMAGCVPSGWPDGHRWVSIVEVVERYDGKVGVPVPMADGTYKSCDRCLSLASASSLIRNRA